MEPLGSETVVIGRLPDGELLSVKVAGAGPAAETMRVAIPAGQMHVFDAETRDCGVDGMKWSDEAG